MTKNESTDWTAQLAAILNELADVQDDLLEVIDEKREKMQARDLDALDGLQQREKLLAERLQNAHQQRSELLARARRMGLEVDNLQSLAKSPVIRNTDVLSKQARETSQRMRLLQHQSLTNWVVAQRTLLHLSQMLEIIATGGRLKPTYGDTDADYVGGALVDREV